MKVLVDTPVWSLALRRKSRDPKETQGRTREELKNLILEKNASLIGPIRQELLSGIRDKNQFNKLRDRLRDYEDISIQREDYETAAKYRNTCESHGIAGSPIDFLICAVASRLKYPIFTLDRDFVRYAKHLDITLYKISWRAVKGQVNKKNRQ